MQTLGLSDSTPRTEGRLRALLWPTIRNEADFDYVTTQGFWICFAVAALTIIMSVFTGAGFLGVLEGVFFFFAGVGVRQRSRAAALVAFSAYLLSGVVMQKYTGNGFGVARIIFLALLFANIRGNWLSSRWPAQQASDVAPERLGETFADKLSDRFPMWLWPKIRIIFYIMAVLELSLLLLALVFPPRA